MKLKKIVCQCGKVLISGLLAFGILTAFCQFYYNIPVHYDATDRATDYVWEKKVFYCRATEGIAWGHTNNEGMVNSFDYVEGMPIDILVMGSSHMEGFNVGMTESLAGQLSRLLPDEVVYNIGTSGHDFLVCVDNLYDAVQKYKPSKYIIIDMTSLGYSDEALYDSIDGKIAELPSYNEGLVAALQKNSFLRLVYKQIATFQEGAAEADLERAPSAPKLASVDAYNALFAHMNEIASSVGAELILVYHTQLHLDTDGTVLPAQNEQAIMRIRTCCENNSIHFIDMTERFTEAYQQEHILPHGFFNTSVGEGHLNKHGHAMIAQTVCEMMKEVG